MHIESKTSRPHTFHLHFPQYQVYFKNAHSMLTTLLCYSQEGNADTLEKKANLQTGVQEESIREKLTTTMLIVTSGNCFVHWIAFHIT